MRHYYVCVAILSALAACNSDSAPPGQGSDSGLMVELDSGAGEDAGAHDDAGTSPDGGQSSDLIIKVSYSPDLVCGVGACLTTQVGATLPLGATVIDAAGKPRSDVRVTWSTMDASKATVSDTGLVTGVGVGMVEISASAQGATGSATVTVEESSIARIDVDPSDVRLAKIGDTAQLSAVAYDESGAKVEQPTFQWFSSNELVLTVDQTGAVKAVGQGTAFVLVTTTRGGEATVHVVAVSELSESAGWKLAEIDVGVDYACGVLSGGKAYCWGYNRSGQLGIGTDIDPIEWSLTPLPVAGDHVFHGIAAGMAHSCALEPDGAAWCWGSNTDGRLGVSESKLPGTVDPVAVEGGLKFSQISAGSGHTCALDLAGKAYCWGYNASGELGNGNFDAQHSPVAVQGGLVFSRIFANLTLVAATCGLTTDGHAYCWGSNEIGLVGNGASTLDSFNTPQAVAGDHVFADLDDTCGVTKVGQTLCWGMLHDAPLDEFGNRLPQLTPRAVASGLQFVQFTGSCGRTAAGDVHCLGDNYDGQLGNGSLEPSATPVKVAGNLKFRSIHSGTTSVCGLTVEDAAYCWGSNAWGQLGAPSGESVLISAVPWPVVAPD